MTKEKHFFNVLCPLQSPSNEPTFADEKHDHSRILINAPVHSDFELLSKTTNYGISFYSEFFLFKSDVKQTLMLKTDQKTHKF